MKISSITTYNAAMDRLDRIRMQERKDTDYRAVIERRSLDRIIAERVARNIRLGNDKGCNIDVEC